MNFFTFSTVSLFNDDPALQGGSADSRFWVAYILNRTTFLFLASMVLVIGSAAPAHPEPESSQPSSPYSALDVSPSARAAGLGDCFAPISDDASALYFNPAGLALLERGDLSVSHLRYIGQTLYESAAYAMPFQRRGGWGLHVGYIDYGSFPRPGNPGEDTGLYNARDLVAGAAIGLQVLKDLSAGLQTSWTSQTVDQSTRHGLWWDFGLLAQASNRLRFGLALKNMGVAESGGSAPFVLQWGFAYRGWSVTEKKDGLLLCAGSTYSPRTGHRINSGIEFNHQERFFFRLGYSPNLSSPGLGASQGINVGAGVRVHQLQLDYTYSLGDKLDEFHRVSVSYLFPSMAPQPAPHRLETVHPPKTIPVTLQGEAKLPTLPANPNPPNVLLPLQNQDGTGDTSSSGKSVVVLPFKLDDATMMTAEECLEKGQAMERQAKWRDALKYYLLAVEKSPNLEKGWLFLGNLQVRLGMEAYREALRLNPGNETLRQWLDKPLNK